MGRDDACDLILADQTCSRHHARLLIHPPERDGEPPSVEIEDLNSSNGSFVNDVRLTGRKPLKEGDRIRLGRFTTLNFLIREEGEITSGSSPRRMVLFDPLTDLPNRASFEQELTREFHRANRYGRYLSVALVDVDALKNINDKHGKNTGDESLRALADILRANIRICDSVARYGGEEFALLFPETDEAGARAAMERLSAMIRERRFGSGLRTHNLTVSVGIATLRPEDDTPAALLLGAEQILHDARKVKNAVMARV